jgi:hypothetical protein
LARELEGRPSQRKRLTEPPVKLQGDVFVQALTNEKIATMFQREDEQQLEDVYRGR